MQIAIRAYESAISGAVPDSTDAAIDKFFDTIDRAVDSADRILNRSKQVADRHRPDKRRSNRQAVIEAEATTKPPTTKKAEGTSIAKKPHFYIVESITSAGTLFVVTDGGNARTECQTREFAEKILRALEKAP